VRIPASTIERTIKDSIKERIAKLVKMKPIRAANIFGPALIIYSLTGRNLTKLRDVIPIRLNWLKSVALNRKSTARKASNKILFEYPKTSNMATVNTAFNLATLSFTRLSETGHMAYVFISFLN
jgi:hypothetical protein